MKHNTSVCPFAFLALSLLRSASVAAQGDAPADTIVRPIGEVVVTGARARADVRHLSQSVSVLPRKAIDDDPRPSLLPVLTEQVPGLFTTSRGVMGFGVSGGAAGGISLRGFGGGVMHIAGLYTSVSPKATERFTLWNARAQFRAFDRFGVWARVEDVLARRYEINAGYPMPRATAMAVMRGRL